MDLNKKIKIPVKDCTKKDAKKTKRMHDKYPLFGIDSNHTNYDCKNKPERPGGNHKRYPDFDWN